MKYNILVVEDDKTSFLVINYMIKNSGYDTEVYHAEHARQAIYVLDSIPMDLIFMDISMPEMNGMELTAMLRSYVGVSAPIVAVTALDMDPSDMTFYDKGFNGYIQKPIGKNGLNDIMFKYLGDPR